ncbi:MAG: DUF4838 domain-containing protein [Victivallales bacterium]|nr:DUF4838 domain-containing protein [Victivallales bacterium]
MSIRWIASVCLASFCLASLGLATAGEIRQDGQRLERIVVAPKAPRSVVLAAKELQAYLQQSCGARLAIVPATDTVQGNIFLGTSATPELVKAARALAEDGYVVDAGKGSVTIVGRDQTKEPVVGLRNPWRAVEVWNGTLGIGAFGETGTLYGVYAFLERTCGIRWYMPGKLGTVVPRHEQLEVPAGRWQHQPAFPFRYSWFCNFSTAPDDALWYRRAGYGAAYPAQIIDSFAFFQKHKNTHPEYFALVDGKRDFQNACASRGGGHLCLTNPDVAKQWVTDIRAYFAAHPEQRIFPLAPNDGLTRICGCPKCAAEIDPKAGKVGHHSNHIWRFVNTVAEQLAEHCPDKLVGCLAYEGYRAPPTFADRLHPNVAVMFCKSRLSFPAASYKAGIRAEIEAWRKKTGHLYIWEYYRHSVLPWRGLPVVFPHIISEDLRYLADLGVAGEFVEAESWERAGASRINMPGLQHLNLYVTGKAYWNPQLDMDLLLDEYFKLFYGPASKPMRAFWLYAEDLRNGTLSANPRELTLDSLGTPEDVFSVQALATLGASLDKARALAPADSLYRARIDLIGKEFAVGRGMLERILQDGPPEAPIPGPLATLGKDALPGPLGKALLFTDKAGLAAPQRTYAYLAWDEGVLRCTFVNYEPHPDKLRATCRETDGWGIWEDDCLELFLCPDAKDRTECRQLIVNAAGVVWDGYWRKGEKWECDKTWSAKATTKVTREANRWILELTIPLASLGLPARPVGTILAANIFRSRVADSGSQQFSCWAPIYKARHLTPGKFGTLTFVEAKPAKGQ